MRKHRYLIKCIVCNKKVPAATTAKRFCSAKCHVKHTREAEKRKKDLRELEYWGSMSNSGVVEKKVEYDEHVQQTECILREYQAFHAFFDKELQPLKERWRYLKEGE